MNFLNRSLIVLMILSLHHISFSMNQTQTDSLETTVIKEFRNSVITVCPPFEKSKSDSMAQAINIFLKSIAPQNKNPLYHPFLIITPTNEWHEAPLINQLRNHKQIDIRNKNYLAIMHLIPIYISLRPETIDSIIQLMALAQEKSYKILSILVSPIISQPTPQLKPLPHADLSGWRRMPIAPTTRQVLAPQKTITKDKRTTPSTSSLNITTSNNQIKPKIVIFDAQPHLPNKSILDAAKEITKPTENH